MLFPAGTDRGFRRTPLVTTAIITITVAMFFIQMFAANKAAQESADSQPVLISAGDSTFVAHLVAGPGQPWYTHVTSAFLHADWLHIAGNMIFLAIFGVLIEDRLGHLGMAVLYLSGAVASSLLFDVLQGGFGLGASGAVATITGAFLALMPLVQVRVVTFVGGVLNVTGWVFVLLAVAFDLMLAFRLADLNIGWGAHLGGYAFGFSVAMILLVTRVLAPERHDLFALLKRAKLRRELRQAAALQGARARVDSPRPSDPALADIALRRAAIAERLSAPDFPAAADLYAGMIEAHPSAPAASVLADAHAEIGHRRLALDLRRRRIRQMRHRDQVEPAVEDAEDLVAVEIERVGVVDDLGVCCRKAKPQVAVVLIERQQVLPQPVAMT